MKKQELNLAFAREVAGYPEAFWAGGNLDNGNAQHLPDYSTDWNAVIAEIEKRGLAWGVDYIDGRKIFWCDKTGTPFWGDAALATAVLECVRKIETEKRKYNDRENPE